MSRTQLLGAASAAVLAAFTSGVHAQSAITGGGSTLATADYTAEFSTFNAGQTGTQATFSTYWASGSTDGQRGLLYDDLTCDIDKVNPDPTYGTNCYGTLGSGPGTKAGQAGNTTVYGASDAVFDDATPPLFSENDTNQIAFWASYTYGQALSGNLIQLPSMGVGISLPVNNAALTSNGALSLTDHDLCEIFSGGYTDFSQITDSLTSKKKAGKFTPGTFTVVYRGDGSGTSFILTDHLASVCTPGTDTPTGFTFFATTTFATLFGGTPPGSTTANIGSNAKVGSLQEVTSGLASGAAESGSGGVAGFIEPASGTPPAAIGYISPDYTSLFAATSFQTVNGKPSTIKIAAARVGSTPVLPTVAEITAGLAHPATGYNINPPSTAAQGANPEAWVPLVQTVTTGYPIVGYTTFDFAQCYADPTVTSAVISFLTAHYTKGGTEVKDQNDNGFVLIANSAASKFLNAINQHILANKGTAKTVWNTNIGNTSLCQANGAKVKPTTYVGR